MNKTDAIYHGRVLLRKMRGDGWELVVHENFGWHYAVVRKFKSGMSIKVYETTNQHREPIGKYWCLFGTTGGYSFWSTDTTAKDPNESVRKQWKACRAFVDNLHANVSSLGALIGEEELGSWAREAVRKTRGTITKALDEMHEADQRLRGLLASTDNL